MRWRPSSQHFLRELDVEGHLDPTNRRNDGRQRESQINRRLNSRHQFLVIVIDRPIGMSLVVIAIERSDEMEVSRTSAVLMFMHVCTGMRATATQSGKEPDRKQEWEQTGEHGR